MAGKTRLDTMRFGWGVSALLVATAVAIGCGDGGAMGPDGDIDASSDAPGDIDAPAEVALACADQAPAGGTVVVQLRGRDVVAIDTESRETTLFSFSLNPQRSWLAYNAGHVAVAVELFGAHEIVLLRLGQAEPVWHDEAATFYQASGDPLRLAPGGTLAYATSTGAGVVVAPDGTKTIIEGVPLTIPSWGRVAVYSNLDTNNPELGWISLVQPSVFVPLAYEDNDVLLPRWTDRGVVYGHRQPSGDRLIVYETAEGTTRTATVTGSAIMDVRDDWALVASGAITALEVIDFRDQSTQAISLAVPVGFSTVGVSVGCEGAPALSSDGGVYLAFAGIGHAQLHRYDPAATSWLPQGLPVTDVEGVYPFAHGDTVSLFGKAEISPFCNGQRDWEDAPPEALAGDSYQMFVGEATLELPLIDDGDQFDPPPPPQSNTSGQCILYQGEDATIVAGPDSQSNVSELPRFPSVLTLD